MISPMERMEIIGIIPARYQSQRFPGKPLAKIHDKTLIQHTYLNARRVQGIDHLIIATDDKRIFDHAKSFDADVVMTSPDCPTGSDRLAEVIKSDARFKSSLIVVNIQGDEPIVDPKAIEAVIAKLQNDKAAVMSTAATKLSEEDAQSSSVVKVVCDINGRALYFSRSLIPGSLKRKEFPFLKHIGLYAYRRDFLLKYSTLPQTPLQIHEDLEQLKVLEHGYSIQVAIVKEGGIGVDLPEDIQKVEKRLWQQNTSL